MSAGAVVTTIVTTPRGGRHDKSETEVPRVYHPATKEERDMGLYVMIFALAGMVILGLYCLHKRKRKRHD